MHQNIKTVWINVLLIISFLIVAGCGEKPALILGKTTLEKDTTWQGIVQVNGDVYVPPGVTLTIAPGTIIKFKRIDETSADNLFGIDSPYYPQAELIVRGSIVAKGSKDNRIVFTSAEINARPADWGAINLLGSEGNVIEYARILFAYNGIHAHGSQAEVSHNEFANNGIGISFKSEEETPGVPWFGKRSTLTITGNQLYRNKGGIGFRNSDCAISHNEIRDNKFFGLWPKEDVQAEINHNEITGNKKGLILYQTKGLTFVNNNIYDNTDYNIAAAEAQDFIINAPNNWFGTIHKEKIQDLIFDGGDDPDLGVVTVEPYLEHAVEWELP